MTDSSRVTPGLTGMELEQPSPVVDARQLAAQPDFHLLPGSTEICGHRVEGVLAGHVVIGMDLGGTTDVSAHVSAS